MIRLPRAFLTTPLAHRALHGPGVPENSIPAIRAAVDAGYGIEIDIQASCDGVAMVFHDDTLERLTDRTGPINRVSSQDLGQIELIDGCGTTVPTLKEVLGLVAGAVPLLIEIKDQDGALGTHVGALERAVLADLEGYDGAAALMSFNPYAVVALRQAGATWPLGLTTCSFASKDWPGVAASVLKDHREMGLLEDAGASFISHDRSDLASPEVAKAKVAGMDILCWTIRSAAAEAEARKFAQNVTFEGYWP